MGRKAKYFTVADKMAAQQQQQASYIQTERQVSQNARAYAKRHGRHRCWTAPKNEPQPLETTLVAFATLPLPNSYLFRYALAGSRLIDESDLAQWDKPPPYHSLPPPEIPDEEQFTQNLLDVMHRYQLRQLRVSCIRHAAMFNARGSDIASITKEIQEARKALLDGWNDLHTRVTTLRACARHKAMAECYQQWQARKILNYQQEEDQLARGENPYV
ncbi:uncharacterized protein F5147DRAFT_779740 [Suillus discolor]|uniref:Uncharacterized protein n=1 Tax=Suillus discolor TaxID=1912936 RepID=A0A9P7JNA9_9AGAM|nr:uncharacterized protein F5147DRAFT_779740 [Suillus discolor]KAG2092119.1 hypothetical protein F5147DRAFT_779740 [Suillus discolor]